MTPKQQEVVKPMGGPGSGKRKEKTEQVKVFLDAEEVSFVDKEVARRGTSRSAYMRLLLHAAMYLEGFAVPFENNSQGTPKNSNL